MLVQLFYTCTVLQKIHDEIKGEYYILNHMHHI